MSLTKIALKREIACLKAANKRLQASLHDLGAYGGIPEVVQENAATQENNRALTAEIKRLQGIIDQERLSALACSNAGDEAIRWLRAENERLQDEQKTIARILACPDADDKITTPSNLPNVIRDRVAEIKRLRELCGNAARILAEPPQVKIEGYRVSELCERLREAAEAGGVMEEESGTLRSPYGYMTVDGIDYCNGCVVVNGRLEGVAAEHKVPEHWIEAAKTKET